MRKRLEAVFLLVDRLRPSDWQRTLAWAAFVGFTGALATLAFRQGLVLVEHLLYGPAAGLVQAAEMLPWPRRLAAPAVGGALAGLVLLLARRLPRRSPHGDYMEAVVLGRGELDTPASLLRAVSSACTVASGGAIGREGPMVQLAALTGSLFAAWRDMPVPRRRLLVACAAAAGLTTAYGTPIAGALFIAEIVLQSLATATLAPLLIASVTAHATVAALVGSASLYRMPDIPPQQGPQLLLAGALGLAAGLVAPLYLRLLDLAKRAFGAWHASLPLKMAAGGLVVGALSIQSPQVWGNGFSVVNSVLQGHWAWQALLLVLVLKLAAVAATTGSGAVGGIFTPTLFVGAVSGALFALVTAGLPLAHLPVPAGAAIGMGAFLAASTHAPLTSVLMIFEMTENYTVVAPLMLACVLAYSVSRLLRPDSVYASSDHERAAADPRLAVAADLLHTGTPSVRPGQSLEQVELALLDSRWRHVYVVDAQGRFLGAISMHDLAARLKQPHDPAMPWPADLLQADYPRLRQDMPLWGVLGVFERHAGERLPVIDVDGRLVGHLAKTDLVLMLRDRLAIS
ncbi:ClcB-like voltage-gated chloride channel protein [Ramlibacter sp. MMS24-I3-19]|uniref:ClcB-like voltage-gated chloride channel protein n=1 Tax=Ramlibacter sp. MMS24-I3-19 TaxID=3416606 RepID=UPI003D07927B